MPTSLNYVSVGFQVQSATALDPFTIRVRFTYDPITADPNGANDGLNPANYIVSGAFTPTILAIVPVGTDPQSVDLALSTSLTSGTWNVFVSNVEDIYANPLGSPTSASFNYTVAAPSPSNSAPLDPLDAFATLRRHVPDLFKGNEWDSLLRAIANGDSQNWALAQKAFDQLWISSSSGDYLIQRAGDVGVTQYENIGISDAVFRQLAIAIYNEQLTIPALLRLLEVYYGIDSTRGWVESANAEPYAIRSNSTLILQINGQPTQIVVSFKQSDFAQSALATAAEVAAAINRTLVNSGFDAFAQPYTSPTFTTKTVRIYSGLRGLGSKISVVGGTAQTVLEFPSRNESVVTGVPIGSTVEISIPSYGKMRVAVDGVADPSFLTVKPGDYLVLNGTVFNQDNQGSFAIEDVVVSWNGTTYDQYVDVTNEIAVVQASAVTVTANDLAIFSPVIATTNDDPTREVIVSQAGNDGVYVQIPATTQIVGRDAETAAYLRQTPSVVIDQIVQSGLGTSIVETVGAHGLLAGQQIILQGIAPVNPDDAVPGLVPAAPATTGNPALTAASFVTVPTVMRSSDLDAGWLGYGSTATKLGSSDEIVVIGGRNPTGTPATFDHVARLEILDKIILPDGNVAAGRPQYEYNWSIATDIPSPVFGHQTFWSEDLSQVVVIGGQNESTFSTDARLYDPDTDTWSLVPNGTPTARSRGTATKITYQGQETWILIDGLVNATTGQADVQAFTATAGGTIADLSLGNTALRFDHKAVAVAETQILVAGGTVGTQSPLPNFPAANGGVDVTDFCEIFDPFEVAPIISAGRLTYGRCYHQILALPNGDVMVFGGWGRNMTSEFANRVLSECEIFSPVSRSWRSGGRMAYARMFANVVLAGDWVYVLGGCDTDYNAVPAEKYNWKTGKWRPAEINTFEPQGVNGAFIAFDDESSFGFGGVQFDSSGGFSTGAAAYAEPSWNTFGADTFSAGKINRLATVGTIISGNEFVLDSDMEVWASFTGGEAIPFKAVTAPDGIIGPHVLDADVGPSILSANSLIQQRIPQGSRLAFLDVLDATSFPDENGWLVANFGGPNQSFPIPYLGRESDTRLRIRGDYVWPHTLEIGTNLTLLQNKGPAEIDDVLASHLTFVTGTAEGRLAAQRDLDLIVAAGLRPEVVVIYPDDTGLGNAGFPVEGDKISDKVYVWGGDE